MHFSLPQSSKGKWARELLFFLLAYSKKESQETPLPWIHFEEPVPVWPKAAVHHGAHPFFRFSCRELFQGTANTIALSRAP